MPEYKGYLIREWSIGSWTRGKSWTVHDQHGGEQISIPFQTLQAAKSFIDVHRRRTGEAFKKEEE